MSDKNRLRGQPIFILSEDTQRTKGLDAQESNITAGKAISEAIRSTLGPNGLDKMVVDDSGNVVITNDGATVLNKMKIEHPAAQMIAEVTETQEDEVGDGTTTAAILAGQLLLKAQNLLDDDIHPTTIVEGYHQAVQIAREAIDDLVLDQPLDEEILENVAVTSMTGKGFGNTDAESLAWDIITAVQHVRDGDSVNTDEIHLQTQVGAPVDETELFEGIVLDTEPAHENMPRSLQEAEVAILDTDLGIRETEIDTVFNITDAAQLNRAIEMEESELRDYSDKLSEEGVELVFVTGSIDERVAEFLTQNDILAFEDVGGNDAHALSRATGAKQIGSLEDLKTDVLGRVKSAQIKKYGDDDLVFVDGGSEAKSVTLFLRGTTEHVLDELKRAVQIGINVVSATIESGGVVPGGGAVEIAIAARLRDAASSVDGRRQLAIESFADALEILPRTLATNAGLDPIDSLVELRVGNESGRAGIVSTSQPVLPSTSVENVRFISEVESKDLDQISEDELDRLIDIAREASGNLKNRAYAIVKQKYLQKETLRPQDILGLYHTLLYAQESHLEWVQDINRRLDTAFECLQVPREFDERFDEELPDSLSINKVQERFEERQEMLSSTGASADGGFSSQEVYLYSVRDKITSESKAESGESVTITDPIEYGILDPAAVKREAIQSATEAATMIIRIDDVISAE